MKPLEESQKGIFEAIQTGVNSFHEGMPVLISDLGEVAKIHPFIQGKCDFLFFSGNKY